MVRPVLVLLLALVMSGCETFPLTEQCRNSNVSASVYFYDTIDEVQKAAFARGLRLPGRVCAFTVDYPAGAQIHTLRPRHIQDVVRWQLLGHEYGHLHCGNWHRGLNEHATVHCG